MENKPTKELVRKWLQQRRLQSCPPPSIEEIRLALGWKDAEVMHEGGNQNADAYLECTVSF